jgi:SAM-dependent methyltransferase
VIDTSRHNEEIAQNLEHWNKKPSLQKSYRAFHQLVAEQLADVEHGQVVELGSGIGNIKETIPECIRTDLFDNPWIDQVENAYDLSFADASISNLIMFDVFHHLRYPGTALAEAYRACMPTGRLIIFEPCVSLLGSLVYGPLHAEPLAMKDKITWQAPDDWSADDVDYYAAQGNASRVFLSNKYHELLKPWSIVHSRRISAFSYVATGGYSMPQLYPDSAYPLMRKLDKLLDYLPWLFATRLLVVLEKP